MMISLRRSIFAAALSLLTFSSSAHAQTGSAPVATTPLASKKKVSIPTGGGGWDWMMVDAGKNRLLATHKGQGTVEVLNLKDEKTVTSLHVGTAQGIAIDEAHNKYYFGDADEKKVIVVDRNTLKTLKEISVTGPVDAMGFDPKRGMVYADEDDGKQVWMIDTKTDTVVGSVAIAGAPEWVEYDATTDKLYQNIKTDDSIQVIDPVTKAVVATWKTTPATGPHGLAMDTKQGRIFSAGKNGILVMLDRKNGNVLATLPIGASVDQIAYDPTRNRVYCACRGVLSVAELTKAGKLVKVGDYTLPAGAHTVAVDTKTHAVWVCYSTGTNGFLEKF